MYLCILVEVDPLNEAGSDGKNAVGGTGFGWTVSYAVGAGGVAVPSAGAGGITLLVVENRSGPDGVSATEFEEVLRRERPKYPRGAAKITIAAAKPAPINIVAISKANAYSYFAALSASSVPESNGVHNSIKKKHIIVDTLFIVR